MSGTVAIAVTGDTCLNRRLSVHKEEAFLSLVKVLRSVDVAYTHLETLIHDYDGPEIYPAAEAGWTWMRSPLFVADELKWAGFDLVSLASNHCLDYSYGGLFSTWKALDQVGIVHAGTGRNLGEAREPAFLDTSKGRVALVSICSSFAGWSRAGDARRDMKGRPGLNPLRFHYRVDTHTMKMLKRLAVQLGWWVTQTDNAWLFNPAGLHNTVYKFVESDEPGVYPVVDQDDSESNLRSVRNARRQADYVLVHLHTHEWDPEHGLHVPAKFVPPFARACIDAGADVFIGQGSHASLRGIEVYRKKPIFYDPGDFIGMSLTVTRLPADFYWREGYRCEARSWLATTADGFDARANLPPPLNPRGGYFSAPVVGSIIGVCSFRNSNLVELRLHPILMVGKPRSRAGLPLSADAKTAKEIIEYLGELSAPFGTTVAFRDGLGVVEI